MSDLAVSETPKVMIVEARFYDDIADELVKGATDALKDSGFGYDRFSVPGAFEIPAAIKYAIRGRDFYMGLPRYAGYIALGCVIRGETTHYDYICTESARALQDLAVQNALAIGNGILTCENREQAWARANTQDKNKGGDAAEACLEMIKLKQHFHLFPQM